MPYLKVIGLTSHHGTTINNNQSWPSLQQTSFGKHQSGIASHSPRKPDTLSNHRPGKLDTLSYHVNAKLDMLFQHVKCRQAIPSCIAEVIVCKGLLEPRTVESCGNEKNPIQNITRANMTTSQEARQSIRHEA